MDRNSHEGVFRQEYPSTATEASQIRKDSPIQRVVNQNGELLEVLTGLVLSLSAHLAPVSRRHDTVSGENRLMEDKEFLGNSELIDQLLSQQRQIERLSEMVRDLEAGLEV